MPKSTSIAHFALYSTFNTARLTDSRDSNHWLDFLERHEALIVGESTVVALQAGLVGCVQAMWPERQLEIDALDDQWQLS